MNTNPSAPLNASTIEIGGATRTIRFTMNAHRIAKKRLGRPIKDAVRDLQALDIDVLCELAAAGLTEGRAKGSRDVITPERVAAWLDDEPRKVAPLAIAVSTALTSSFERMFEGEANAANAADRNAAEAAAVLSATTSTTSSLNDANALAAGPTSEG
ncbi:MAG: hypothetical protein FJ096_02445 [Deltaproteobacteria bacterium]|nr:hypothetical protein [Deltaproteobacteria bacterium]